MRARIPENEDQRLAALQEYAVLDTGAEQAYDDITMLAAYICDVPMAMMTLVDEDRQWFKSKVGLPFTQTPRDASFCAHAILEPAQVMVVTDASQDPRFARNPMVLSDPGVRFYAGAPLVSPAGLAIGTVCVIDSIPRELDDRQIQAMKALSRQVVAQLELRKTSTRLKLDLAERKLRQAQIEEYQQRLEMMNRTLVEQSTTDPLTGLKNRRAFDRTMNEQSSRTERSNAPLSLMLLDVDQFKLYNDQFGHVAGDQALRQIAQILQEQARTYDDAARYGGEEFAVVLPDTPAEHARIVAERVRAAIERFAWPLRPVTVSIGVATTTTVAGSMTVVERADKALYQAKRNGRNCVVTVEEAA